MANIIGGARAKLADVQCSRLKFEPGDRILVRYYTDLDDTQRARLRKSVEKWAGGICEVLLIDGRTTEVQVERKPTIIVP